MLNTLVVEVSSFINTGRFKQFSAAMHRYSKIFMK